MGERDLVFFFPVHDLHDFGWKHCGKPAEFLVAFGTNSVVAQ